MRSLTWLVMLLLVACAHREARFADPINPITDHPRLMYRSLAPTEPQVDHCRPLPSEPSSSKATARPSAMTETAPPKTEPWTIAFQPDQWHIPPDDDHWQDVLRQLDPTGQYLIVGHSHGGAEQEPALLAQRRAEFIVSLLKDAGFEANRLRRMASWSSQQEALASSVGVHIFVMDSATTEMRGGMANLLKRQFLRGEEAYAYAH